MARAISRLSVVAIGSWIAISCASSKPKTAPEPELGEAESTEEDETTAEELDEAIEPSKGRGEGSVSVTYAKSAAENWRRGEEEFADESYLAAQKYYSFIRSKFPYSSYAVRAELRIADCLFERERYLEAIDAYSNFQRLHPSHKQIGYAAFKVGLSYYEMAPSDWFMLPPSWEREQKEMRDAARALTAFVERHPNDPNHPRGVELLKEVRERLVKHERSVADFYKNIEKTRAYVGRLETIRAKYPDVGLDDELLLEIAEAYAELGEKEKAKQAVEELQAKFPSSKHLPRARALVN
jgi:outer membrane protein assembly factor BamD